MPTPNFSTLEQTHTKGKNYIHCLHKDRGMAFTHEEKEKVIADYFKNHLGKPTARARTFDWQSLGYTPRNLGELEVPFREEEIRDTIDTMPSDKAPGPDGFTGAFLKLVGNYQRGRHDHHKQTV
jgi:hypothetical protein